MTASGERPNRAARGRWVFLSNVPVPEAHLLGLAVGAVLRRTRPLPLPGPRSAHRLVGLPLITAGAWRIGRAVRAARRTRLAHPDRLVVTGPYAVSRNPMYVGWALLHLGGAVARGSGWGLASFVPVAAWMHREVLREERVLDDAFGAEYRRYRAAVPRYSGITCRGRPGRARTRTPWPRTGRTGRACRRCC
ncbi:isoprenylcysteine carboxylmethyltransferase family protein [Streptomyces solicathayae]|uniref:Isoprenylcysteine carboxylmethyltransferase family protein n=1 Tax=Streptomyces solicathayae TaxID=3081768 RepID=A0ABZ0M119_9ACTN|nr:isoprenylcysteine carboxylmethyltransferase family protein [Streptomyces sp. HUAS YS2]WOX25407.1 isoprenylcysteine carboxylmethyltransferase family protein [Streptomyces sp. HUAS YS2]